MCIRDRLTPEPERMKGVKLKAKASLGIRPMGKQVLDSEFSVTISPVKHKIASDEEKLEFRNKFSVSVVTGNVPDALWGKCAVENDVSLPKTPEAKTIEVAVGIRISCIVPKPQHELLDIQIWKLAYQNLPKKDVKWQNPEEEAARGYGADDTIFSTILASKVIEERKEICDCLKTVSYTHLDVYKRQSIAGRASHPTSSTIHRPYRSAAPVPLPVPASGQ